MINQLNNARTQLIEIIQAGLVGLSIGLFATAPVHAQIHDDPGALRPADRSGSPVSTAAPPSVPPPSASRSEDVRVPDWAAPKAPPPSFGQHPGGRATTNAAPTMPGGPAQAPVDGGLGWLAAAGAAYAVRRLYRQSGPSSEV